MTETHAAHEPSILIVDDDADDRSCAVAASLSRMGKGVDQLTMLMPRDVTHRYRPAPAGADAPGQHPPELQT